MAPSPTRSSMRYLPISVRSRWDMRSAGERKGGAGSANIPSRSDNGNRLRESALPTDSFVKVLSAFSGLSADNGASAQLDGLLGSHCALPTKFRTPIHDGRSRL